MSKWVIALFVFGTIFLSAQPAPSVRASFRDKVLEAIQDTDGVDPLSSEIRYALSYLNARKSVTATGRAATGLREMQSATQVAIYLEVTETCRIQHQAGQFSEFSDCLKNATSHRDLAIKIAGIDPKKVYPREAEPQQ